MMQICHTVINLKNLMRHAEKNFERYKILIMYSQITSHHNHFKFAFRKQYVKIDMFSEL